MGSATFRTVVLLGGKTATGLPVPEQALEALGGGRRAAVVVALPGHAYRSTLGARDGVALVPLSAEHRAAAEDALPFEGARTPETRERRVAKVLGELTGKG